MWKILKDRFGNVQQIVSSHMERLVNLHNISSDPSLTKIRKLYNEIDSHVRCLDSLNVKSDSYSALLAMGKLPPQLKLFVSCNLRSELWGLAELLDVYKIPHVNKMNHSSKTSISRSNNCNHRGTKQYIKRNISITGDWNYFTKILELGLNSLTSYIILLLDTG